MATCDFPGWVSDPFPSSSGSTYEFIIRPLRTYIAGEIKQVVQWATIAHLGASITFGDTIINDAQRQVTLNLIQ